MAAVRKKKKTVSRKKTQAKAKASSAPKSAASKKSSPARRGRRQAGIASDYSYINRELDPKQHSALMHRELLKLRDLDDDNAMRKATIDYAEQCKLNAKAVAAADSSMLIYPGRYAALVLGGAQLPEKYQVSLDRAVQQLAEQGTAALKTNRSNSADKTAAPVPSVQDRIREQVHSVTWQFDVWLDRVAEGRARKKSKPDPLALMQEAEFKAAHAAQVRKIYTPDRNDIAAAISKSDADLVEGYGCHSVRTLKAMLAWLDEVLSAANMISQAKRAQRKVRKPVSVERQVSKIKYCESDTDYGVASIDPALIVGAQELWVFNVRHRKLGRYLAADVNGLSVKGTSIVGYHTENSVQVTLRKPKQQLPELMSAGKVQLRKFLGNIRGVKTRLNGRINANVVLLRAIR